MVDRRENQLRIPVNTKFTMHTDHCSNQEEIDHVYDQDRKCCIKIHKNRLDGGRGAGRYPLTENEDVQKLLTYFNFQVLFV